VTELAREYGDGLYALASETQISDEVLTQMQTLNGCFKEQPEFLRLLSTPKLEKSYKVALCIEGKSLSSEAFSQKLEQIALSGKNTVVYLIGSSWGLSERVKQMCDLRLSFSPMTFAHSLFRVMLAEQIYRAEGIGAGAKYHK
jgi:rRNA large subunit m3Psi methyltransferase RlmH